MLANRKAWRIAPGAYEVVGRKGNRYSIEVENGIPVCSCPAAQHGRRCWHQQIIARRLLREMEVA